MFINKSFVDVFSSISEVYVSNSEFDDLSDIDYRIHQIIIFEDYREDNAMCPNHAIYDNKEYELCVVASINDDENSLTKYTGTFFSRHGGYHSKWWKQIR